MMDALCSSSHNKVVDTDCDVNLYEQDSSFGKTAEWKELSSKVIQSAYEGLDGATC
jgi:hypothetical protein